LRWPDQEIKISKLSGMPLHLPAVGVIRSAHVPPFPSECVCGNTFRYADSASQQTPTAFVGRGLYSRNRYIFLLWAVKRNQFVSQCEHPKTAQSDPHSK